RGRVGDACDSVSSLVLVGRSPAPRARSGAPARATATARGDLLTHRRQDGRRLLADAAVDAFAEQVGVTAVTRVLLDHVHQHFAQLHLAAVAHRAENAEVVGFAYVLL